MDYTDADNPKCVTSCPNEYYIDEITDDINDSVKLRKCVPSCKDLEPAAYIYFESDRYKCIRNCSLSDKIYVN